MFISDFLPLLRHHLARSPNPRYGDMARFIHSSGLSAPTVYKYLSLSKWGDYDRISLLVFLKLLRGTHYPASLLFSIMDDPMTENHFSSHWPMKQFNHDTQEWQVFLQQDYTGRTDQWGFGLTMKPVEPLMPENMDHFHKAMLHFINEAGGPYQAAKIMGIEYESAMHGVVSGRQKWIDAEMLELLLAKRGIGWTHFNNIAESYLDEPPIEWKTGFKTYRDYLKKLYATSPEVLEHLGIQKAPTHEVN